MLSSSTGPHGFWDFGINLLWFQKFDAASTLCMQCFTGVEDGGEIYVSTMQNQTAAAALEWVAWQLYHGISNSLEGQLDRWLRREITRKLYWYSIFFQYDYIICAIFVNFICMMIHDACFFFCSNFDGHFYFWAFRKFCLVLWPRPSWRATSPPPDQKEVSNLMPLKLVFFCQSTRLAWGKICI